MMQTQTLEIIIDTIFKGKRLDFTLASLFPEYSRAIITKWIKDGAVYVNGSNNLKPKDKVSGGDKVIIRVELQERCSEDAAQDIALDIVYEDDFLMVVNKPEGLVVHPGAGNRDNTLVNALLFYNPSLKNLPRAGIVHRLDKDTTGLLLIAKDIRILTELTRMMQNREIKRKYLALVLGNLVSGAVINTQFGRHKHNRLKMAVVSNGKEAITEYRIEKKYKGFTLLKLSLITGRTHQIRVHMEHIRHPIVGDKLYKGRVQLPKGLNDKLRDGVKNFKRQALHAYTLEFIHPVSGENIELLQKIPQDFLALLNLLDEQEHIKE